MKMHRFVPLALLLLAAAPAVLSQGQTATGSGETRQNPSVNCADSLFLSEAGCSDGTQQGQQQNSQSSQQQPAVEEPGALNPRSLGTAPADNAGLGGQARSRVQPAVQLPLEPPTEFQKFVAATTGQLLPIYGANLFRNVPSTFAPIDLAPVTDDYLVGPDDELRIRIWGQINYTGNLRVDRSGDIFLPQIGNVHVTGLQFSALNQHLHEAVGRIYRNFDLSVDMGRIRSIQVFVTGQARRPGVYSVSALSSLVDTLFASGGPSPQGSLRHILVNRNGKTIADFDLYALLLHGDKSHDVRLMSEDVLYIPAVGPEVAIAGSINNPAIYEARAGETIRDLIEAAGKTSVVASNTRISVDRQEGRQHRQAMEFGFDDSGLSAPVLDGDIFRIYSVVPAYRETVTLRGNVANPGRFGWHTGMRLSDLIPDRDSLESRDYWWNRSHQGLPALEFEPIISSIGAGQQPPESNSRGLTTSVTQETLTSALRPKDPQDSNDAQRPDDQQDPNAPGRSRQTGSSGTIASELSRQPSSPGGATQTPLNSIRLVDPGIDWDYAVIERTDPDTLKSSLIPFDLGKLVLNHDSTQDLNLQPGDAVTIFSQADIRVPIDAQTKYVKLEGEFVRAGFYSVQPGETLRDLVRRSGGLTSKAYLYGSEFDRESTRRLQQQRLDEYVHTVSMEAERGTQELAVSSTSSAASTADVNASRIASQGLIARLSQVRATGRIVLEFRPTSAAVEDIPEISLQNGDKFVVPSAPSTVNVIGAVYNQNSFLYQPRSIVGHYLKMAGGPNRNADWKHSFVIRADGSVVSSAVVKGTAFWSKGFNELRLNPGDTIIVPDKTLRPTALRGVLDWTQIFSQLALGAAAIHVL